MTKQLFLSILLILIPRAFADHQTPGDLDVPAARARLERAREVVEHAQHHVHFQEEEVHKAHHHLMEAIEEEKKAKDKVERETETLKDIENEVPVLQQQISDLERKIGSLKAQTPALEQALSELTSRLSRLESELAQLRSQLPPLDADIASEKAKLAPILREIEQLKAKKAPLESALKNTEADVHKVERAISETGQDIARIQVEINEEKAKTGPDASKIASLEGQKTTLQRKIEDLSDKQKTVVSQIQDVKNELDRVSKSIAHEKKDIQPILNKIQNLEGEKTQVSRRIQNIESQISKNESEKSDARSDIARIEQKISEEKAKPKPDKEKLEKLEERKKDAERRLRNLEAQTGELNGKLSAARADLSNVEAQLALERAKVGPALAKIQQLESEKSSLEGRLSGLQAQLSSLTSEIQSAKSQVAHLNAEIDKEKSKPIADPQKIARLEQKKANQETKLAEQKQRLSELQSQASNLRAQIQSLNSQIGSEEAKAEPVRRRLAELENQRSTLQRSIDAKASEVNGVKKAIAEKRRELDHNLSQIRSSEAEKSQAQAKLADHPNRVERQKAILLEAKTDLIEKTKVVKNCIEIHEHAKHELEHAEEELSHAFHEFHQAEDRLRIVIENYNRERERVLRLADQRGMEDGGRESAERASDLGLKEGRSDAESVGLQAGTADARDRDDAGGYRNGRQNATQGDLLASYQLGEPQGRAIALSKARAEDFPLGYNDTLKELLQSVPSITTEIDITEQIPQDPGGTGTAISTNPKPVGSVASPQFPMPVDPDFVVPTPSNPSFTLPVRDNRYFNPPCSNLPVLDFIPICREQYDTSYQTGFSRDFRESYGVSFKAGFSENIRPAYERALLQSFPDLFKQAEQRGAKDQGILDAFAQTMPQVKADEYARGRQLLSDTLSTGYLLSAQKLVILDGDADGVLTPGESVKLALTIDNHGKQASPLAGARFRIISHVGLENIQFEARELPAIQAQNRVKLTGVTQAKVAELSAGEKIRVEGVLELKTAAGDFVPIGQVSTDSEVHFPLELEALTPAKAGRVDETISAKVRFRNRGSKQTDAVRATLLTQPAIVSVPSGEISIPSLESGAASEMNILIKPGVWVGGNTLVKFVSRIASTTGTQNSQVFRQKIDIDRAGSLHLFDLSGKELPMATIVTSAGSTASFLAQFKFQRTTSLPGPFVVHATRTSDPEITLASGSTTSVNYGSWSPSKKADLLRFNYAVPTKLKGQSAWVMIQLSEANQAIHAMQVFLDVR